MEVYKDIYKGARSPPERKNTREDDKPASGGKTQVLLATSPTDSENIHSGKKEINFTDH